MVPPDSRLDVLARDLDDLAAPGAAAESPEIADAREAVRQAAEAISRSTTAGTSTPDVERALTLAGIALERARRAVGGAAAPRPHWQDALRPPLAAEEAVPERRRAPSGRDPDVVVDSEIPDGHPAKSAIETSIAGAFAGVKGRWRVSILVQPSAPWWGIRVEGGSICWTGTLEGADEQSPEFLGGRVREAVRLGLMQAALRRPRTRG